MRLTGAYCDHLLAKEFYAFLGSFADISPSMDMYLF